MKKKTVTGSNFSLYRQLMNIENLHYNPVSNFTIHFLLYLLHISEEPFRFMGLLAPYISIYHSYKKKIDHHTIGYHTVTFHQNLFNGFRFRMIRVQVDKQINTNS